MWSNKDTRTGGEVEIPVNTDTDHYIIVWPEGEIVRTHPLAQQLTPAEDKFKDILKEGLMIRGSNGMLEWINIPKFDYAYIAHRTFNEPITDTEDE